MANGVITWNGVASDTLGIVVSKVPSLNRPQRKFNSYSVPGRNGDLVVMQDAYAEYEQEYEIFALDGAQVDARAIVDWLYQDGWCKLADDWEPEYYRMAYFVGPLDIETLISEAAVCTITFRCRPQRFIVEEPITVASGGSVSNPTNHIAKPIITLTGPGSANLIDLRNKTAVTSSGQVPIGSFQLSALIQYFNDGKIWWVRKDPTVPTNDIEWIGAYGGTVSSITASSGRIICTPSSDYGIGLVAPVKPDTDYYFQEQGLGQPTKVVVWFGASDAYNTIISRMEIPITGQGIQGFAFHTPTECAYVLIGLYSTAGRSMSWDNIMLSSGTSRRTFRPYVDSVANTFTLGNTALKFSLQSFEEAVIDCERENFTVDGAEMNGISSVQDQYGNLSVNYLQLNKGDNAVSFSGDIASVTIDRRIWQL